VAIAAREGLNAIQLLRFNPNHVESGEHGGEFMSGAGGGLSERGKKRAAKLERIRKAGHKEIAGLKREHAKDRRELVKDQAKEWKGMQREQVKERNQLRREHTKEPKTARPERRDDHAALKKDQAFERQNLREDHQDERKGMLEDQREDRREVVDRLKEEVRDEFPKRKTANRGRNGASLQRADMGGDFKRVQRGGRIGRAATHKASSAEAILRYCLSRRGWTDRWERRKLTIKQRYTLLKDIRLYGRRWIRRQCERLLKDHQAKQVRAFGISWIASHLDKVRHFVSELFQAAVKTILGKPFLSRREAEVERFYFDQQAMLIDNFERKINTGMQPLDGTFVSRSELDAAASYEVAQNVARFIVAPPAVQSRIATASLNSLASVLPLGTPINILLPIPREPDDGVIMYDQERRVITDDESSCIPCTIEAAKGWVPFGTLPEIGDLQCCGNCRCYFEFRSGDNGEPIRAGDVDLVAEPPEGVTGVDLVAEPPIWQIEAPVAGPPPKAKPTPKPEPPRQPPLPVPSFEELKAQAEAAGATFSGVEYEEL